MRSAAARAGFEPRLELAAADLAGKMAMIAAGHTVAIAPEVLAPALRRDVVGIPVTGGPDRTVYISTRDAQDDLDAPPGMGAIVAALLGD